MSTELKYFHPVPGFDSSLDEGIKKKQFFSELTPEETERALYLMTSENSWQRKKQKKPLYTMADEGRGPWCWERAFLSSVIAGAEIPEAITSEHFRMPWNKIIFEALYSIRRVRAGSFDRYNLLIALLSQNPRFDQCFRDYLDLIESLIGVPGNAPYYAERLILLKAGLPV